jgi:uncharacterized HAD superfamily protein
MKPMKIGVDMDGVLVGLIEGLIDYHNKTRGTDFSKEDLKTNAIEDKTGFTFDEAIDFIREFLRSEDGEQLCPIDGATSTLSFLKDTHGHELFLITARSEHVGDATRSWVNKHLPGLFSEIHLLGLPDKSEEAPKTKGSLAEDMGIRFFIEDSLSNARNIASHGVLVFLLDRPWNQDTNLPPLITRVKNWYEIKEKLTGSSI